jgi:hypothetical protein
MLVTAQSALGEMAISDGSANAPTGAPEMPNLLSSYASRPNWAVAGVDYYVGTPRGTALKSPMTILIPGVLVDPLSRIVTVSGSNVILDGYDFSQNGGWGIQVTNGAQNVNIQNSYFKVGPNNRHPINAANVGGGGGTITVRNCTFDGSDAGVNVLLSSNGYMLAEYNRFTNVGDDAIYVGAGGATIQYNLFDNMGNGNDGSHPDAIQSYFTAIPIYVVRYNTVYQPPTASPGGSNAFVRIGDQRTGVVRNPEIAFNTLVLRSLGGMPNAFQLHSGTAPGTLLNPSVHDNYIDPTAVSYAIIFFDSAAVNPTTWGNINLKTGKAILNGPWNSQTANVPAGPPPAPAIVDQTTAGTNQLKLTGAGPAGTRIDLYDQEVLLGSTISNSNGAWSFTTGQLTGVAHAFTARAIDPYSNASSASRVFDLNLDHAGPKPKAGK